MGIILYALSWGLFAIVHSMLARPAIQSRLENYLGCTYRLFYNLLAFVSLLGVMYVGVRWLSSSPLSLFTNPLLAYGFLTVKFVGLLVLVVALLGYDLGRFSGVTQLFTRELSSQSTNEALVIGRLNQWVRHPLYTGAFLVLWGNANTEFAIWTAIWGSVYLVIGSYFEERKLVQVYADSYREYRRGVPKFFPRLGQIFS